MFIFISSTLLRQGVCVCTIWIDVKLLFFERRGQRDLQSWPLPTKRHAGGSGKRTCLYLYIYIVLPLGAFKSQLGGPISYRCCFLSLTTVILLLYIYVFYDSSSQFYVGCVFCTSDTLHFTIRNDSSGQVCVCVCVWGPFVKLYVRLLLCCRGHGSCFSSHANEARGFSRKGVWTQ